MIAPRQASVCIRCIHRLYSSQSTLATSHSLRTLLVSPALVSTRLSSKPHYIRQISSALPSKPQGSKGASRKKKKQASEALARPSTNPGPSIPIADYTQSQQPPGKELDQLQVLVNELLTTNSPVDKRAILARYPDQAPLLSWIYSPLKQFHVRPNNIVKYGQLRARQQIEAVEIMKAIKPLKEGPPSIASATESSFLDHPDLSESQIAKAKARATKLGQGYDTLASLLAALSVRTITGHSALDAILLFMTRFCSDTPAQSSPTAQKQPFTKELFATPRSKLLLKILDKNLKTGCSAGLIRGVYPGLIPEFHVALAHNLLHLEDARTFFTASLGKSKSKKSKSKGDDAKTNEGEKEIVPWFGSRKLDGVRCLIRIDRATGTTEALSRTGREYASLNEVQEAIRTLVGKDEGARNDFFRKAFMQQLGQNGNSNGRKDGGDGLPEAMILDGEICVFSDQGSVSAPSDLDNMRDDDDLGDELGRENFLKAVSLARRGMGSTDDGDIEVEDGAGAQIGLEQSESVVQSCLSENERMVYCIFDCVTNQEFLERKGSRTFSDRIHGLVNALPDKSLDNRSSGSDVVQARQWVRVLNQTRIKSFEHLEKLVGLGLEHGWEGVMLRKDVAYEGKRSRNLLKIKQFQDAEFKVEDAMIGRMRLPFQGEFQERDQVLTNVVILHRGNRVGVGSGFSAEDRIRFGQDPSLIIGKTITVQYFEESKTSSNTSASGSNGQESDMAGSNENDDTVWSLRFPTVKAIYGSGRHL
ncbi:hypothetical protein BGZ93_010742 [Podila epicladia]|nr:hypothetical protein BGZ92_002323 [Podila epicladia]KAG0087794.1 hypothetical protein BGZ93_010742 [Podila epicladia]